MADLIQQLLEIDRYSDSSFCIASNYGEQLMAVATAWTSCLKPTLEIGEELKSFLRQPSEGSGFKAIKRRIGLVTQDDVLLPQLTVDETLVAAFLRLPGNIIRRQRNIRRRKKRKGYEILVDPSLLLLDEPTSGLDSTSANRLLQILQGLAKAGRTIITTIHQPSSRMFHMFDKLLLISEGYPLYYGKARESMECFSDLRFIPEIAMNPAEFLLDLATGVNDISVPEDLSAPNGVLDSEKAVINIINS
ncbi:hypothetical protein D5086_021772 [Populus alba]|uniref:Uncharacterized protein n=1 Tax=Populus alba TaxID=43335 RepID=A0ACC4BEN6_POPAL